MAIFNSFLYVYKRVYLQRFPVALKVPHRAAAKAAVSGAHWLGRSCERAQGPRVPSAAGSAAQWAHWPPLLSLGDINHLAPLGYWSKGYSWSNKWWFKNILANSKTCCFIQTNSVSYQNILTTNKQSWKQLFFTSFQALCCLTLGSRFSTAIIIGHQNCIPRDPIRGALELQFPNWSRLLLMFCMACHHSVTQGLSHWLLHSSEMRPV